MNTDLRKAPTMNLKKTFSSSPIIQFLEKQLKMIEHRDIKSVRTETRRNYLVSEPWSPW